MIYWLLSFCKTLTSFSYQIKITLMKKGIIISFLIMSLGFLFECLHLITDYRPVKIEFWPLGIGCMVVGLIGLLSFTILPVLASWVKGSDKYEKKNRKK